jgi:hypothetical protein
MRQIALRMSDEMAAAVDRARGAGTEEKIAREQWIRGAIERRLRLEEPVTMAGGDRGVEGTSG